MSEIAFYHLTRSRLEEALPRLLEKAIAADKRVVVRVTGSERLDQLDRALWTYDPASFLPHGSAADGFAERQPIWLTTGTDNPNGATILVLIDNAPTDDVGSFERVLELFDGADPEAVAAARGRWRWAGEQGFTRVYWQQDERGRWQRAASS